MKIYYYIGKGRGVPGLPHKLNEIDVMKLGVEKEIADALKSKQYAMREDSTSVWDAPREKGQKPAEMVPTPYRSRSAKGKKEA